jgi:hypothetical protein
MQSPEITGFYGVEDRPDHTGMFTHSSQPELPNTHQRLRKHGAQLGTCSAIVVFLSRDTITFVLCKTLEFELLQTHLASHRRCAWPLYCYILKLPSILRQR